VSSRKIMEKDPASMMRNYEYFMKLDTTQFRGEWVVISEEKVVAHGKHVDDVWDAADNAIDIPFLANVKGDVEWLF
jgi:hypothetical protein